MSSSKKLEDSGEASDEPTAQELKADVHALLQLTKQRAKMLFDAYSIMSTKHVFEPSSMYPDIRRFAPRNSRDCEVQAFNTSFLPPLRCMTAESIATWLLDPASLLNRRSVAVYLSGEANSAPATLEALADKICLRGGGSTSLTEALKDYLSATGCIDLLLHPTYPAASDGPRVRSLLLAFARARMVHCKSPFGLENDDATPSVSALALSATPSRPKLVSLKLASPAPDKATEFAVQVQQLASVAAAVLALARALCLERQSPDEISSEFLAALKVATSGGREARRLAPMLPSELASLQTEPFLDPPLAPLPRLSQQPSHLFCDPHMQGWGRYRFTRDSASVAGYLVLCADALYVFDTDISASADADAVSSSGSNGKHTTPMGNRFPSLALPLQQSNAKLDADRGCIELTSCEGCDLAVLVFGLDLVEPNKSEKKAGKGGKKEDKAEVVGPTLDLWVVERVDHHGCLLLEISSPSTGGVAVESQTLHDWLDGLESVCREERDA